MTINDQIRDEKLQNNINRKAAEISTKSSGKLRKYEYLTGEDIFPSNQQQIMEQARFTCSPLRKAIEKQIKTIEGQGQKQIDALEKFKPKEEIKLTEHNPNNQPRAKIILNDFINKRKELMNELYSSVYYNSLNFKYVDPKNDVVSFYEYRDSIELFDVIINSQIEFADVKNKQNEFSNKLSSIKVGKKTSKQKEMINNTQSFYNAREEVINFLRYYIEMLSDANYDARKNKIEGKGLEILTPKQMLQKLPIALAQIKAGKN